MALYRCFSINIFMGALRPQRRKNGFCCRGLDAGSDLQPALSCWLLCPALHTHARLLQPISRQHKVSNVLVYTSPQCPPPQQEMVVALRKRVVQPPCTSLSSGFAICSLQRVQMYLSFTARQSSMGLVFRDTKQSQSQRESLQALSILARRSTPSQTSPPFLTARMETGSQDSLLVWQFPTFFSSGFCCAVVTVGGLRAVSYFQASKTLRQ